LLFVNVFGLLITVTGVSHDLMEQLLFLAQLFRKKLPAIFLIEIVIGSSLLA